MSHWDVIDITSRAPWFVVSYYETQIPQITGDLTIRTMLMHRIDQLENFINSLKVDSANIENVQVSVVMPGYMTGRTQWSMEPLVAIMKGLLQDDSSQHFDVFETSDGSRFAEFLSQTSVSRLQISPRLKIPSLLN